MTKNEIKAINVIGGGRMMPDGSETNQFWNGQKSRLLR